MPISRIELIPYKDLRLTPDTLEAFQELEKDDPGLQILIGEEDQGLKEAGREVAVITKAKPDKVGFSPTKVPFIYQFYGPWSFLGAQDRQKAALADVGRGTYIEFVQAQIHRIGKNPGPIDGVLGKRTLGELAVLNLTRCSLLSAALALRATETGCGR